MSLNSSTQLSIKSQKKKKKTTWNSWLDVVNDVKVCWFEKYYFCLCKRNTPFSNVPYRMDFFLWLTIIWCYSQSISLDLLDFRYQDFMNILVYRFKGLGHPELDGLSILPAQFVERAWFMKTLVWVHISESVLSKCEEASFILRKTTTIKLSFSIL